MKVLKIGNSYRDDTTVGRAMQLVPRSFYDVKFEHKDEVYVAKIRIQTDRDSLYECTAYDDGKRVKVSDETEQMLFEEITKMKSQIKTI